MISVTPEYELPYYHDASQVTLDMVMDNDNLNHVLWNRYSYSIGDVSPCIAFTTYHHSTF